MVTQIATVDTYRLAAQNGKPIGTYTMVTFANGQVVKFMGRLGKRDAIRQALQVAR